MDGRVHLAMGDHFAIEHWTTQDGDVWPAQSWIAGDFDGDHHTDVAKFWDDWDENGTWTADVHLTRPYSHTHVPTAVDDVAVTDEDNAVVVQVLANDTNLDGDTLTVTEATQGTHGAVNCTAEGVCKYTPERDFNGMDQFTYEIRAGSGNSASATVRVTVHPVNDAPVPHPDTAETVQDTSLLLEQDALLANDRDVEGDALTITAVLSATHGHVALLASGANAGKIRFAPVTGFTGTAGFVYTVSDGHGGSTNVQVTVTISLPPRLRVFLPLVVRSN